MESGGACAEMTSSSGTDDGRNGVRVWHHACASDNTAVCTATLARPARRKPDRGSHLRKQAGHRARLFPERFFQKGRLTPPVRAGGSSRPRVACRMPRLTRGMH